MELRSSNSKRRFTAAETVRYFMNYDDKDDDSYGSGSEDLDVEDMELEMAVDSYDVDATDDGDLHLSADDADTGKLTINQCLASVHDFR